MSPRKKSAAKEAADAAAVAKAAERVARDNRGAPEVIRVPFVQVLPVENASATITTTAAVEPVVWEDVPAPPTVQRASITREQRVAMSAMSTATREMWEGILQEPVVVAAPPCALEGAHIGAKCVVSRTDTGKVARLLTSKGAQDLDKSDIFYTLPPGAKVQKMSESRFDVYRLGVNPDPIFSTATAREAVQRFLEVVV